MTTIEQVKEKYEQQLMTIPGVVGVAIGLSKGQPAITVMMKAKDSKKQVPDKLEGYPVAIDQTGEISAQSS